MYFTISTLFIDVLPCPVAVSPAARTRSLGIWFTAGSLGAIGAYQLQASIDGPTSYLAIAAPVVALRVAPRNRPSRNACLPQINRQNQLLGE
jgi:hypothetical protein